MVGKELVPQLKQLPGFIRYVTATFDDGRVGSMSVFENEDSARRSTEVGRAWVSRNPAMQAFQHDSTLSGLVLASVQGSLPQTAGYTISRRYKTDASRDDLKAAFDEVSQAFKEKATGLVRWSAVALSDGGVITYGWFDSAENARNSSQVAAALTQGGSMIARVLPNPPHEVLTGKMMTVYN